VPVLWHRHWPCCPRRPCRPWQCRPCRLPRRPGWRQRRRGLVEGVEGRQLPPRRRRSSPSAVDLWRRRWRHHPQPGMQARGRRPFQPQPRPPPARPPHSPQAGRPPLACRQRQSRPLSCPHPRCPSALVVGGRCLLLLPRRPQRQPRRPPPGLCLAAPPPPSLTTRLRRQLRQHLPLLMAVARLRWARRPRRLGGGWCGRGGRGGGDGRMVDEYGLILIFYLEDEKDRLRTRFRRLCYTPV